MVASHYLWHCQVDSCWGFFSFSGQCQIVGDWVQFNVAMDSLRLSAMLALVGPLDFLAAYDETAPFPYYELNP